MIELLNEACESDPASCPNGCGRSYTGPERKGILKTHLIYSCGVNPKFKCKICSKQLRHKHTLKYHMMSVHRQNMY